jgi:hypothetical protein
VNKKMRYSLRRLLIVLGIVPPLLALPFCWPFASIETVFQIRIGMSKAEVEAIAGRPMERSNSSDDGEYWQYYTSPLSAIGPEMVEFDSTGRVIRTWSQ